LVHYGLFWLIPCFSTTEYGHLYKRNFHFVYIADGKQTILVAV